MDVKGHSAIVTGGASGLGEASARLLAEKGAKVAVFDLQEDRANSVAKEIGGTPVVVDITDDAALEAAFAKVKETQGSARFLIHCAGAGGGGRLVGRDGMMPLETFTRVINLNLVGSFNTVRRFAAAAAELEPLKDKFRGAVVMTASVAAYEGQIGQIPYSASKAGIVGMTIPMARDLSSLGIRVCTIAPGVFLTPMAANLREDILQGLADSVPFPKRLGAAEEFGALAVHICENEYLNGETIRIDGAIRMAPR